MTIMLQMRLCSCIFVLLGLSAQARSAEQPPTATQIRAAIAKALPPLDTAARISAERRKCFTCHNQGLPMLVMVDARQRGFDIDEENLQRQIDHTAAHLKRGKSNYLAGVGQGGKADTAGSALWALDASDYPRDEITDAVVEFFLQRNADTPYWSAQSKRPPSEGSRFTSTFFALRGMEAYGFEEKRDAIDQRRKAALEWLNATPPKDNEDRVFRLRALALAKAEASQIRAAATELLKHQQDDGSWSQLDSIDQGDAYATGSALAALYESGHLKAEENSYRRGLSFLLRDQKDDGTWHVISRSRPIQEPYDTGFPHGDDQFISASASAWATLALLNAIAEPQAE
jgi:N-acyl-D-amino-acid deacylase